MKAIINGKIILKDKVLKNSVLIYGEKIEKIVDKKDFHKNEASEIIDVKGAFVGPGFIDIHIHGFGGYDTMDGTKEALRNISERVVKTGVTSFLPTTMTMDRKSIIKALNNIENAMKNNKKGANILGCHLEGPFISPKYKGAQNDKFIINPNLELIKDYLSVIKIITMAPEEDEDFKFISNIKNNTNIVISMGHTNTDFEIALESIKRGVSHATHTFNAMTPLHHRKPGAVGAVFTSNMTCEIIADNIHIHPGLYNLILKVKGKDKVILITDSMRAGGLEEGVYDLGGQRVCVDGNSARLKDGTLAGSILTMNRAVENIVNNTDLEIYEVINLATINPATLLNVHREKGSIDIGKDADLFIMDKNYNIKSTFVRGKKVY